MSLFFEALKQLLPIGLFIIGCSVFLISCNVVIRRSGRMQFGGEDVTFNDKEIEV